MNKKGFTLIELLAVVVILGLLIAIAVPNTLSMIDKQKMTTYLENGKTFASLVKSKLKTDRKLEMPDDNSTVSVVTLGYLETNDIKNDPFGNEYNKDLSYVLVQLSGDEYKYYVTLVSCADGNYCDINNHGIWRGIVYTELKELSGDDRFQKVKMSGVNPNHINTLQSVLNGKTIYKNGELYEPGV